MATGSTQRLGAVSVGAIYMRVELAGYENATLPCNRVDYTMSVNEIPIVQAEISMGASILNPANVCTPEHLLISLADRDYNTLVHGMIRCSLWEQGTDAYGFITDQLIFRGYITGGNASYRAGQPSIMQVRLDCQGFAAALETSPGGAYIETYPASLVNRIINADTRTISAENATATGNSDNTGKIGYDQLLNHYGVGMRMSDMPICYRIGIAVAACKEVNTWNPSAGAAAKDFSKLLPDEDVMEALGGYTVVKKSKNIDYECDKEYSKAMLKHLMENTTSSTLWQNIKSFLNSNDFMLDVVPRWSCDDDYDFRMDITPCNAWSPSVPPIYLNSNLVSAISVPHNSVAETNIPDVLLVNFNTMSAFGVSGQPQFAIGTLGIAAKDKTLQTKLRNLINKKNQDALAKSMKGCRVMEITAPSWIDRIISSATHHGKVDARSGLASTATPTKIADELDPSDSSNDQPHVDDSAGDGGVKLTDVANDIAEALFQYYYLRGSSVSVALSAAARFGLSGTRLEDLLGYPITIDLTNNGTNNYSLCIHGVLNSVRYQYSTTASGTQSSYIIDLDRVYLDGASIPRVECPIYERTNGQSLLDALDTDDARLIPTGDTNTAVA